MEMTRRRVCEDFSLSDSARHCISVGRSEWHGGRLSRSARVFARGRSRRDGPTRRVRDDGDPGLHRVL